MSGSPTVPTIADSKLQSMRSRTYKTDMIRLIMECHEEALSSQATQLTATVVEVAMSTLADEHNPRSCRSAVPGGRQRRCGKTDTAHVVQNTTDSDKAV